MQNIVHFIDLMKSVVHVTLMLERQTECVCHRSDPVTRTVLEDKTVTKLFDYYNSNHECSQFYCNHNTKAAACFRPHWSIFRGHTVVQNSCLTFSACNRAAKNCSVYVYVRVTEKVNTVPLYRKIKKLKIKLNVPLVQTPPQLFFYIVTTSIQALVIACDEFLYAFIIGHLQSVSPMLGCILYFFFACEASASVIVGE